MKWVPSSWPCGMAVTYLTSSSPAQRFSVFTLEPRGCWGTIAITLSRSLEILSQCPCCPCCLCWGWGYDLWCQGCNLSIIWVRGTMTQDALLTSQAPGGRADISWDSGSDTRWQLISLYSLYTLLFLLASVEWGVETIANECRLKISRMPTFISHQRSQDIRKNDSQKQISFLKQAPFVVCPLCFCWLLSVLTTYM